jgi:hypothetical protein
MPYKYLANKGIEIKKQKYKVTNWPEYNETLKQRGNIEVWISEEVINNWYHPDRVYDGNGNPELYTDLAIKTIHEIRKVFKLPLRQTQGFIDSFFKANGLEIYSPDYSVLSKRLKKLKIKCPSFLPKDKPDENLASIAVDSSGLKRFGRDEWHQEKHKVSANRSWRKVHIAVDEGHYIRSATLTDKFVSDDETIDELLEQIPEEVDSFMLDGAYDKNPVYQKLTDHSQNAIVVIPPAKNAVLAADNHEQRSRNIIEIDTIGRMPWQRKRNYGRRNYSELGIQRYKRILGNALQSREIMRQKQEAMIACGVLNKMTSLGMPKSVRIV